MDASNYGFTKQGDKDLRLISQCSFHYAKAMAYTNTNQLKEAHKERTSFKDLLSVIRECPENRYLHNNTLAETLAIAEQVLEGEVLYREAFLSKRKDTDLSPAFDHLREAVRLNDCLGFDEPWGWMHPPRHILGAFLLEQGQVDEAEKIYRQDLGLTSPRVRCYYPNNIWSLKGLQECFQARRPDLPEDYALIMSKLRTAEGICDDPNLIPSSCACKQSWRMNAYH